MRGRPWNSLDIARLTELAKARMSAADIGRAMNRTPGSIRMMRHKLGLAPPSGPLLHRMQPRMDVSVAAIKRIVAEHFSIPVQEMVAPSRARDIAGPRQVAMFFARNVAHRSYPNIGKMFGGRDHSTVIHAVRQVERRMNEASDFKDEVRTLELSLVSQKTVQVGDNCQHTSFVADSQGS